MAAAEVVVVGTLVSLLAIGCHSRGDWPAVDLTAPLGADEARAGVITDEAALWGGISAEGRVGDVKIYNSRARFVIQAPRDGSFYVTSSAGVLDADVVRPDGHLGRDAVDEWIGMYSLGRIAAATSVAVIDPGTAGGAAVVRVVAEEAPFELLTGATESPDLVEDLGLRFTTDYILAPDSPLLEVRTTITADDEVTISPGDVLMGALERLEPWDPGVGLEAPASGPRRWTGFAGRHNDVSYAIVAAPNGTLSSSAGELLANLAQVAVGFGDPVTIPAGESVTWTRYYAVAPDLATISAAALALDGVATDTVSGTVTAPDGPVAGARVNVLVDGAPYTVAVTDEAGAFETTVPAGSDVSYVTDGRGTGLFLDLPEGAAPYSPYAAAAARDAALATWRDGGPVVPRAEGRGVADGLTLGEPGTLTVRSDDGASFEVRVGFTTADAAVDERLVADRPYGYAAVGWARDGEVTLEVEPGRYHVVVWRGARAEVYEAEVDVAAGAETVIDAELPTAYTTPGWWLADPHLHASPSGDVTIAMEDRLIAAAAQGLDLHFGTDHDHIADYTPLLAPLGLDDRLASVLSDEVSPVLRGHLNIYPVSRDEEAPNGGAWAWWRELVPDTATEFAILRERHGDFVLQSNHPLESSGLASAADWAPGVVADADHWSDDFDAVEVLNAASTDPLPFWLDITSRGLRVTPVGVSDSHGHVHHDVGLSSTWLPLGDTYSDDALRAAMRASQTIVTRGPFLELSVMPGSEVAAGTTLSVRTRAPSWIVVETLELWRDGAVVETVTGTEATFTLSPEQDAWYVVVAQGSQPMSPVTDRTPWAMTSPYFVDVDGDGWEPPLSPLTVSR